VVSIVARSALRSLGEPHALPAADLVLKPGGVGFRATDGTRTDEARGSVAPLAQLRGDASLVRLRGKPDT
jgi:hypothetical protein